MVFLAVTGMPWSEVWGSYVQRRTTAASLGGLSRCGEAAIPSAVIRQRVARGPSIGCGTPSRFSEAGA
jgi:hypothetical protein